MATSAKVVHHHQSLAQGEGTHERTVVPRSGLICSKESAASTGKGAVSSANGEKFHHHYSSGHSRAVLHLNHSHNKKTVAEDSFPQNRSKLHSSEVTLHAAECSDSSTGESEVSSFSSPPLLPVPWEMAEAIKRQQKGSGTVRYWRAKQLHAGGSQPLALKSGSNSLLPTLRHFFSNDHGSGNHFGGSVGVDGDGVKAREGKNGRSKAERWKQKGRENLLTPSRNTVYSGSMGHYPPLAASYKRSVTSLDSLLPPPFLAQPPLPSHNLQQKYLQPGGGALHTVPPDKLRTTNERDMMLARFQGQSQGQGQAEVKANPMVTELTCLQLADTILRTKMGDLPRFYQLCQTKIRYMDLLEQSTDAAEENTESPKTAGNQDAENSKARSNKLPKPALPYSHRARASRDPAQTAGPLVAGKPNIESEVPEGDAGKGTDGTGGEKSSVSLPVLPASVGLSQQSLIPVSSSSAANRTFWVPSDSSPRNLAATSNSADAEHNLPDHPIYASQGTLGKPILKPSAQDGSPVDVRCKDPFSQRSVIPDNSQFGGDLRIRGTTMYPFSTAERWSREASNRRTHSSRGAASLRRRAVRFSISDQVREFTPSEPLLH